MTRIIFRVQGTGPPVLMLHAFPLNSRMWQPQLDGLAGAGRFLAPDLPGFGASAGLATIDSLDGLARMIYEESRAQGVDKATVAGCSIGGYLAFALFRVTPGFVGALALINTKASPDNDQARANRLALAARVKREGCSFLVDEWPQTALSADTITHRSDVVAAIQSMIHEATPDGGAAAQIAMAGRPDSTGLLKDIDVPTVVIHGLDDRFVGEAEARAMAQAIPRATFVGVPHAGHIPGMEQPESVNAALGQFLSGLKLPR
jgi:pimeloyl-ACP methyl ester carboxylesterase